jgi:prepilin peptidase CpaA
MGAGDVKLVGAFGAWLGPMGVLWAAMWASLAGGVLALVIASWRGYLLEALRNVGAMVGVWRVVGPSPVAGMTLRDSRGPRLAYALPIGIGALLALWRSVS